MRYIILSLLCSVVLLSACRKTGLTTDSDTDSELDPSVELKSPVFKGTVQYGIVPLSQVTIKLYQNEAYVGSVQSDAEGKFSTEGIDLVYSKQVTFYTVKEGYISSAKRLLPTLPLKEGVRLVMSPGGTTGPSEILPDPGSPDLVKVSGYVLATDGSPVPMARVDMWYDLQLFDVWDFTFSGTSVYTDEDGYYEHLVPKGKDVFYVVFQGLSENNLQTCNQEILSPQVDPLWPPDIYMGQFIGPFESDTVLATLNNGIPVGQFITLSARLLDCNGQPVTQGRVAMDYQTPSLGLTGNFFATPDGVFSFQVELCGGAPLQNLQFQGFDDATGKSSTLFQFPTISQSTNLGDIVVCQ